MMLKITPLNFSSHPSLQQLRHHLHNVTLVLRSIITTPLLYCNSISLSSRSPWDHKKCSILFNNLLNIITIARRKHPKASSGLLSPCRVLPYFIFSQLCQEGSIGKVYFFQGKEHLSLMICCPIVRLLKTTFIILRNF
jgi:hypothetical protein